MVDVAALATPLLLLLLPKLKEGALFEVPVEDCPKAEPLLVVVDEAAGEPNEKPENVDVDFGGAYTATMHRGMGVKGSILLRKSNMNSGSHVVLTFVALLPKLGAALPAPNVDAAADGGGAGLAVPDFLPGSPRILGDRHADRSYSVQAVARRCWKAEGASSLRSFGDLVRGSLLECCSLVHNLIGGYAIRISRQYFFSDICKVDRRLAPHLDVAVAVAAFVVVVGIPGQERRERVRVQPGGTGLRQLAVMCAQ